MEGLFAGGAILNIDGQRTLLKAGETGPQGVRLLRADSQRAVVVIGDEQRTLTLSTRIHSSYSKAPKREVALSKHGGHSYFVNGRINGRSVEMLVDTGATHIAMNSEHARQLGIDYESEGKKGGLSTASGVVQAWYLNLNSVSVAGITVHNVKASVSEGLFPSKVLLGMSYLNHVKLEEKGGLMYLQEK